MMQPSKAFLILSKLIQYFEEGWVNTLEEVLPEISRDEFVEALEIIEDLAWRYVDNSD